LWYNFPTEFFFQGVTMKKRSTWLWIVALSMVMIFTCAALMGLGLWSARTFGGGEGSGLPFGAAVAIIRVEGVIVPGEAPPPNPFTGGAGGAFSETIVEQLKQAEKNDDVKAVVLFVDSPGGSVFASEEITLQIKEMTKPIISSMGSVAASGGYYVSAPTQEIWASPHTLTCSIGVIMQLINVEDFAEEYGVTAVTVKSGQFKDIGNPFREVSSDDLAILQSIVDEAYENFVGVVAEGRSISAEQVRTMADGRICSGKQAQAMGLVDNLGYLKDAIDRAAELGDIDGEPRLIEYTRQNGLFEALGSALYRPSPIEELRQVINYHPGSPLMYLYTGP
jgi:protease-4